MVAQIPTPPQWGNVDHPSQGDPSSSTNVFMLYETIGLVARSRTYDNVPKQTTSGSATN